MKRTNYIVLAFWLFSLINLNAASALPAFPGAQGGAAYVTGGRGGKVLVVNSLEDDRKLQGTLRWAIDQNGSRTIVFAVAGIIDLKSELKISKGDLTIAGQSAPGDGICIKGFPVKVNADNVIIRFIRFRMGDENAIQDDALNGIRHKNIMIDHCSMSWSTDECSSFYDNENFTMQWCIISESLRSSVHKKGAHGYGGIWGGKKASFHHNLLAHHDSRNPRFCGSRYSNDPASEKVDFRNNVIYNWGSNSAYAGEGGSYNMVNNYYKPGPLTLSKKGKISERIISPNSDDGANSQPQGVWGKFYISGNKMEGSDVVTRNNWEGVHIKQDSGMVILPSDIKLKKEVTFFRFRKETADKAYRQVLTKAGASFVRDTVDKRIVHEVKTGTFTFTGSNGSKNGVIDTQTDVGGWPAYTFKPHQIPVDSDGDGIPDVWETANGLNKNDSADSSKIKRGSGYTYLEVYLNSLVSHLY